MPDKPSAAITYWLYAAVWLCLVGVHAALLLQSSHTVLDMRGLSELEQLTLATFETLLFGAVLALTALGRTAFGRAAFVQRLPRSAVVLGKSLRAAALVFVACFYAASWAMFRSLGSFLDGEGLRFVSMNPKLLLQHLVEINLAGVGAGFLVGSGAFAAIVTYGPERARGVSEQTKTRVFRAAVASATLLATFALTMSALFWQHRDETRVNAGLSMPAATLARDALARQAGPLTHLVMGLAQPQKVAPVDDPAWRGPKQAAAAGYAEGVSASGRPNVVVIVIEALRDDAWRKTEPEPVMPHLQALARASLVFNRAYSQANHSDYAAPCVVSSQYPLRETRHHYYDSKPPFPRVMLYDVLKSVGYRTAIVSSQNEHWGGMLNFLSTSGLDLLYHSETHLDPSRKIVDAEDAGFQRWATNFGRSGKIDDGDTMAEAVRWMQRDGQPFFLSMNLQNSHFPYRFPAEHDRFRPSEVDFPYTYSNYPIEKNHVVRNRYYNALHYADAQLGRLLNALGPQLANTIVVVTGDHGEAFFEHGFGQHGAQLFEETIRVGLVMHLPGHTPRVVQGIASHVDVAPTVLSALDLPVHPAMQGHDLLQPIPPERAAFVTVQTPLRWDLAVISGRHKLVTDGVFEKPRLVDLQRDPLELRNLATDEPGLVRDLTSRLRRFRDAQLTYYHDQARMRDEYPPRVQ